MLKRFALGAAALCVIGAVGTASILLINLGGWNPTPPTLPPGTLAPHGKSRTILVLGSDRRFTDGGAPARSDTMMLVRLDPEQGATSVLSLPRDLRTSIPGHGTDKLNAAYALGGEALTIKTVQRLLAPHTRAGSGFAINHVVNVRFGAFQRAVNYFDCMYVDVDRRYFNDNDPPAGGGPAYATIDIPAGYQRLCGRDSLDFVRYRHLDSDLVRAARQQGYVSLAKDQVGFGDVIKSSGDLLKIISAETSTDLDKNSEVIDLLDAASQSADKPVRQIQFPVTSAAADVIADQQGLTRAVRRFLNADAGLGGGKGSPRRAGTARSQPGLVPAGTGSEDVAIRLAPRMPIPLLYPSAMPAGAAVEADASRAYAIEDRDRRRFASYRIVFRTRLLGQYYGVQGTTWRDPPILKGASESRGIGRRKFSIYKDGARIRLVALKTPKGAYWVSNTLSRTLSNAQMLALARSLGTIGSK